MVISLGVLSPYHEYTGVRNDIELFTTFVVFNVLLNTIDDRDVLVFDIDG